MGDTIPSPPATTSPGAAVVTGRPHTLRQGAQQPPSVTLSRRQSASARIHELLEAARERAESMQGNGATTPSPSHPEPARRRTSNMAMPEQESSADEMTGMVLRGEARNYQSTTSHASDGPRSRRSAYRRRSGSSAQSDPPTTEQDRRGSQEPEPATSEPWYKTFLSHFQSVELENKGSVARDHLAIERTFLAWLRTSLAFASIGIAVTQLFRLNTSLKDTDKAPDQRTQTLRRLGKPLGATFLAISILTLFLGYNRYSQSSRWVIKGKFPASRGTIMIVSFVALGLMVASLVVVIVVHPTDTES